MAKKGIHPKYVKGTKIICICGASTELNTTSDAPIKLDSCPSCHPRYTGKKETKVVKGRMEKFLEKQKRMEAIQKNQKKAA